jgi:2'-5' RNA ligase
MEIPELVRGSIGELIAELRKVTGARWVRAESLHVTLKFVGEVRTETLEKLKAALAEVHSAAPVEIKFRGTGFFPNEKRPRVFWAGIEASSNLPVLADEIEKRFEALGIPREQRPFHPHLTLARFDSPQGLDPLRERIAQLGVLEFGSVTAREFHLYQSELNRGGAVYTKLATFPLARSAG